MFSLNMGNWSPEDYWSWLMDNLSEDEKEKTISILWSIWKIRNYQNQHNNIQDIQAFISAIERKIENIRAIQITHQC